MPLVLCKCRDLSDMGQERLFDQGEFATLELSSTMRKAMGTGACQATLTSWFISVRGYDEKYVFWGFEDKDMVHRARKAGIELRWIHEQTAMLHQWHRTTKNDKYVRKHLNKARYYLTRGQIVKNPEGWGAIRG